MDVNFTGQIAATLAENLKPPWYNPLINIGAVVVGSFVTGVITLIAVKITNNNAEKRDEQSRKANRLQRQEQVYSQLRGLQIITDQLYMSIISAIAIFSWITALERLQLPSRTDLGQIEEKHQECNKLDLEIARNNQQLWETIGLIQIRFPPSYELEKLIEPFGPSIMKLREYRESIFDYYTEANVENVNSCPYNSVWPEDVIYENVTVPFEALQEYLKAEIDKGQEKISAKIP